MKRIACGRYEHFNIRFGVLSMERSIYIKMVESEGCAAVHIYCLGVVNCLASEPLLKLEESTLCESWWGAGFQVSYRRPGSCSL